MLDRGVHAVFRALGFESRTLLYCECEPHAQHVLQARGEDGGIDAAPIWPDVTTLRGADLRGRVDAVVGGFPCQDLSNAGLRAGLGEGTRSGLFFHLLRVATECEAPLVLLENVRGIVSAPADVPAAEDEDGEREERAVAVVAGALADAGYSSAWLTLRAADVGAPHERERWFCVGWRAVADAASRNVERRSGGRSRVPPAHD